jgi:hypothetical protein
MRSARHAASPISPLPPQLIPRLIAAEILQLRLAIGRFVAATTELQYLRGEAERHGVLQ